MFLDYDAVQNMLLPRTHVSLTDCATQCLTRWGDNVSEANYNLTYFKEGMATLCEYLGPDRFARTLQRMQRDYRQSSITEPELEAGFAAFLPQRSRACRTELSSFFSQWFDTVYPTGGGANRPQITGPGLDGGGFQCGR